MILDVKEIGCDYVMTTVANDAKLGMKKSCIVPGMKVDVPVVGESEIFDIQNWAVPNSVDFIALSFVQCAADVRKCRKYCSSKPIQIISKIENIEGLRNFSEILAESDGVMVARGDLGMQLPLEKVACGMIERSNVCELCVELQRVMCRLWHRSLCFIENM